MPPSPPLAAARPRSGAALEPAPALALVVDGEARLLKDLLGTVRKQREAIEREDLQALSESVYATHRVLVTLGEAMRRHRSLNELALTRPDPPVEPSAPPARTEDAVRSAKRRLHRAANALSREVEMNRRTMRALSLSTRPLPSF